MKYFIFCLLFFTNTSCQVQNIKENYRNDFSQEEKKILQAVDSVILTSSYTTLITVDDNNQPRARIMEFFSPKEHYTIWMATNPKSRKVEQLKNNSTTTLHYFNPNKLAYVSLMGNAYLVNDDKTKNEIWKDGWEKFYPNREKDYILIKFVPRLIELISIGDGYNGDKSTWKPHQVHLVE